jgi:hypothetical protein
MTIMSFYDFDVFTYYSTAKDCLIGCSLPVEMIHPVLIYKKHIETFSVIRKQGRYSRLHKL